MSESFLQIDIDLPRDDTLDVTIALDRQRPFSDLLGYYELLYDEAHPLKDRGRVILYFPEDAELPRMRVELLLTVLDIEDYQLIETRIDREDYQNSYKEHFHPIVLEGRISIIPEWHRGTPSETEALGDPDAGKRRLPLYLDPGMAFGTGTHPTTRLCLEALDRRVKPGLRVSDAGCGSGVLSIGAALLGAERVLAFDIEENAIQASRHNFALNPTCEGRITLYRGGFDLPEFKNFLESADLVIANVTAAVLAKHRDQLSQGNHDRLILSGVWREHREEVEAAFTPMFDTRWRTEDVRELEGWLLFDLTRI